LLTEVFHYEFLHSQLSTIKKIASEVFEDMAEKGESENIIDDM